MNRISDTKTQSSLSVENLYDALEHVVNKRKGPGIDGVGPEELPHIFQPDLLLRELKQRKYLFQPRLKSTLLQPSGKRRQIQRTVLLDAVVDRAIHDRLQPMLDPYLHPTCIGGRPGRCVQDALGLISNARSDGYTFATKLDVKNFFDEIDRDLLYQKLKSLNVDDLSLFVIEGLTSSPIVDRNGNGSVPRRGIGQGASLSPLLANTFAGDIDLCLDGLAVRHIRWLDDILVLSKRKEDAIHARAAVTSVAKEALGLPMHEKDTTGYIWDQTFLGFAPSKEGGFRVAPKSFDRLLAGVEHKLQSRRIKPKEVPRKISQSLRGWIDFYQSANVQDPNHLWVVENEVNNRIRAFLQANHLHPNQFEEFDPSTGSLTPSLTRSLGWR